MRPEKVMVVVSVLAEMVALVALVSVLVEVVAMEVVAMEWTDNPRRTSSCLCSRTHAQSR